MNENTTADEPVVYDPAMFQSKILQAVGSLEDLMASEDILRPSASGYCPERLWLLTYLAKKGQRIVSENMPDRQWSAMQGNIMEVALRNVLRLAGAQVLDPPDVWESGMEPETLMSPHCDGALLWPEVGINEWVIIESKHLRTTESQKLITGTLMEHRTYLYQAVSYLMSAETLVENAKWDIPTPKKLLFILMPKDPSVLKMFLGTALKLNKGEQAYVDDAQLTARQQKEVDPARVEWKQTTAERLASFEGVYPFYSEMLSVEDEIVPQAWEEIVKLSSALNLPWSPGPLHDPFSTDLDPECAWYCEVVDLCRDRIMKKELKESVV